MRIILSKDRPAQLDLLLTSLERYAEPEELSVIYRSTSKDYARGYSQVWREHRELRPWLGPQMGQDFEALARVCLDAAGEFVTFLCDDDVIYGEVPPPAPWPDTLLCNSLRLGANTTVCYPTGETVALPRENLTLTLGQPFTLCAWHWQGLPPDFGYPGSLDGHIFRTADVQRILAGKTFPNPTALECALVAGCEEIADERPLMACYPHSVLVGVPVNRVSEQSGVRHGGSLIYSAENLNASYLQGMRLDLDGIDFSGVNGAHTELDLRWKVPVVN